MSKATDSLIRSIRTLTGKSADILNKRAVQCYRLTTEHGMSQADIAAAVGISDVSPALVSHGVRAVTAARYVAPAFPLTSVEKVPADVLALIGAVRTGIILTKDEEAAVLAPFEGTGKAEEAAAAIKDAARTKRASKAGQARGPREERPATADVVPAVENADTLASIRATLKALDILMATARSEGGDTYVSAIGAVARFNKTHLTKTAISTYEASKAKSVATK